MSRHQDDNKLMVDLPVTVRPALLLGILLRPSLGTGAWTMGATETRISDESELAFWKNHHELGFSSIKQYQVPGFLKALGIQWGLGLQESPCPSAHAYPGSCTGNVHQMSQLPRGQGQALGQIQLALTAQEYVDPQLKKATVHHPYWLMLK